VASDHFPLFALEQNRVRQLRAEATVSFWCRNSTGTLDDETQGGKESYHGNCRKQVGE